MVRQVGFFVRLMGLITVGFLAGCRAPSPAPPPSPTPMPPTATPLPSPTPAPTSVARPTTTATTRPRADIVLTVVHCLQTFCPPFVLEQDASNALGQPGILEATALDETQVRLVYDPTLLTQEEAIHLFEVATGLDVRP